MAVSLATTPSLPVKNVTVMLLAQWRIHVVLEVSVCATVTMLDLDVTSVLRVITAIPAVCLVSALLMVPNKAHVTPHQGSVSVRWASRGNDVTDAFLQPTVSPTAKVTLLRENPPF